MAKVITLLLTTLLSVSAMSEKLTLEAITGRISLAGPALSSSKLSPDGKRVTYIKGKANDRFQLDLWEIDVASGKERLLVDSKVILPNTEVLSDEEKARRERARTAAFSGIVEYQWSADSRTLLFPLAGQLYLYDLKSSTARKLTPDNCFATDPKMSPKGSYVSFIRDRNLWVIDVATGALTQLTKDASETIANGVAEFIAQEEMDRDTGYWWASDDSAIAFTRTDESGVPIKKRIEIYPDRGDIVHQRYPAAGEANVRVQLGVISPKGGDVKWIDLGDNQDIYLARVNWVDSTHISFQRQSRDQRTLDLIVADIKDATQKKLLTESSETWINLHHDLKFLKSGDFIWASERSGFKHLYLYAADGTLKRPLSSGEFVVDKILAVDEDKRVVYVASSRESPLEKHVYVLPFTGGDMVRLSRTPGMHEANFSKKATNYLDAWSNEKTPPQLDLVAANGKLIRSLLVNEIKGEHPYVPYLPEHRPIEFGTIKAADGQELHYGLTKPSNFDASKKYPVVVFVYGGPHAQSVTKAWGVNTGLKQYLAQQGFVVFSLDNRGTARRGVKFESPIFKLLGGAEVDDQARGLDFLKSLPFVDGGRIGVFGWSYGGLMTLRMLTLHGNKLACGVSGAPVTDWALYDTHYTERYMGLPKENSEGYKESSVFTHLDKLTPRLMLVHGMADDNVLFSNSTQLMSKLQEQGIVFDLMTYPGAKHGAINAASIGLHVHRTIAAFFKRCLQ